MQAANAERLLTPPKTPSSAARCLLRRRLRTKMLPSRRAGPLRTVAWIVAISSAIGFGIGLARTLLGMSPSPWRGLVMAATISFVTACAELFFLGDAVRRLPFTAAVLIKRWLTARW
jgi:hypothetical protein